MMAQLSHFSIWLTLTVFFLYWVVRLMGALSLGYSIGDMDWNEDGQTTVGEVIDASEIAARPVIFEGRECTEFYSLKDGLAVKIRCDSDG